MNILQTIEQQFKKPAVVAVETGDTVRVHQRIREGARERTQIFEGLVIRVDRPQSLTGRITVRKVASGVGVEKGFVMHSPNVVKIEVTKRAKVRRNYISYIRQLTGKSARLKPRSFDPKEVNLPPERPADNQPAANKDQQPEPASDASESVADEPKSAEAETVGKPEDSPSTDQPVDSGNQTDEKTEPTANTDATPSADQIDEDTEVTDTPKTEKSPDDKPDEPN